MAENISIDNLNRQDLLTMLDFFIEHTKQINGAEYKYKDRYRDIANEILLTKYKEPKNLVIAYFLAPFKSDTFFSWLLALLGDYALIHLLFIPINIIIDLSKGYGLGLSFLNRTNGLGEWLLFVLLGTIGYFMGRKNYKQHWFEKAMKKGTYDNEIDAVVDSDPQFIDYKNKFTSLMNDATYQQCRSLLPQNFRSRTIFNIEEIYQILLDYRADNFGEAVNVWRQEQHDREVKKAERAKREAERQAELAKQEAERKAEKAKRKAERKAEQQAENAKAAATASKIVDTLIDDGRFERARREAAEKERDQAIKDIARELKRLK